MAPDTEYMTIITGSSRSLPVDFIRSKKGRYIEVLNGSYNFIFYIV